VGGITVRTNFAASRSSSSAGSFMLKDSQSITKVPL
jgi:hypothetical protein